MTVEAGDRPQTWPEYYASEELPFIGKTVLVTGGSHGIGAEICREFARLGAEQIVFVSRPQNEERARQVEKELLALGSKVLWIGADLSSEEAPEQIVKELDDAGIDKIDVLVNNVGISNEELGIEYTQEDEELLFNTNWHVPFFLTYELAKHHLHPFSAIVNMSSTFALYPDPNGAVNIRYAETKRRLIEMVNMREELGLVDGVRINAIVPSFVKGDNMASRVPKSIMQRAGEESPGGELVDQKQVAEVSCLMASPIFDVTGQRIVVDNGLGPKSEIIVGEEVKLLLDQIKRIEEAAARRAERRAQSGA